MEENETIDSAIKTHGTKYVLMRRCLQCWNIGEFATNTCSECGLLFTGEANEEEKEEAVQRLVDMREKAKLFAETWRIR